MVSACFLDHPVKPDDDPLAGGYPHGYPSTIISGHLFFSDLTFNGKKKLRLIKLCWYGVLGITIERIYTRDDILL